MTVMMIYWIDYYMICVQGYLYEIHENAKIIYAVSHSETKDTHFTRIE